jgi:pimeloyl-ACP methyl ester carboxylesterase
MFIIFHFERQIGPPNELLPLPGFRRLRNHKFCFGGVMFFFRIPSFVLLSLSCCTVAVSAARTQQPAADHPREHFQNATAIYDWVRDSRGNKLRTIVTRPSHSDGRIPVIFFVGWLSCDSVEYPRGETDAFGAIFWRLIETTGYATMRMDKPGVGESEGVCKDTDFLTELSGYRAAFDALRKYQFIDLDRVFVVGLSNGGGTAPLVAQGKPVRGYIAASSWGRTWYEHMLELERVRLSNDGKNSPSEINSALKQFTDFYSLFLIHKMTPGEIIKQHPEWASLWYDEPDGQYGRPAAFYQQLQDLNLGETWSAVSAPVLVLHGDADTIMSRADSFEIANIANRTHPGYAQFRNIPGADHLLSIHGKLADSVVPTMLNWMKRQ